MSTASTPVVRLSACVMALTLLLVIILMRPGEAAKPYEGTTVKVIVNAEFVKYALTLVEQDSVRQARHQARGRGHPWRGVRDQDAARVH